MSMSNFPGLTKFNPLIKSPYINKEDIDGYHPPPAGVTDMVFENDDNMQFENDDEMVFE